VIAGDEYSKPVNILGWTEWGHKVKDIIGGFDKITNAKWFTIYYQFYNHGGSPEDAAESLGFNVRQGELF
jgi:hypothetical protein